MTRTTTPITKQESAPKPADNYGRLLEILERNVARASEPELVQRLRAALRAMKSKSC
jgi:hypothetical protein